MWGHGYIQSLYKCTCICKKGPSTKNFIMMANHFYFGQNKFSSFLGKWQTTMNY